MVERQDATLFRLAVRESRGLPGLFQPGVGIRIQRLREMEPLQEVTTMGGEKPGLPFVLHAFGHHFQAEIVRQADDGERNRRVIGVVRLKFAFRALPTLKELF